MNVAHSWERFGQVSRVDHFNEICAWDTKIVT